MEEIKEKPIRQIMYDMEVGDTTSFPIAKVNTIRIYCVQYGLQWERRFTASINRPEHTIDVTRVE